MKKFIKEWIEQNQEAVKNNKTLVETFQKEIEKGEKRIEILKELDKSIVDIKF